jgi:outer membrane protein assembly factor BamC
MKRIHWRSAFLLMGAAAGLAGCGLFGNILPDKQKQYQYSSEIPPLEIPPDLTGSTVEDAVRGTRPSARATPDGQGSDTRTSEENGSQEQEEEQEEQESGSGESAPATESSRPPRTTTHAKSDPSTAVLAQSADNVALIEIEEPFVLAWNDVARALGRLELEIHDQNRSDGVYYVYFGGPPPREDGGFWEDMTTLFGGAPEPAQEYRVKLENKGASTAIYILDPEGKPQSEGPGLELLKQLHEKLQSLAESPNGDRPEKRDEQPEAKTESRPDPESEDDPPAESGTGAHP